jgi:hypothetical protein
VRLQCLFDENSFAKRALKRNCSAAEIFQNSWLMRIRTDSVAVSKLRVTRIVRWMDASSAINQFVKAYGAMLRTEAAACRRGLPLRF